MSLKASDKEKVIDFIDYTGGVNLNDPAISIRGNQSSDCLNAIFPKNGFKRWPGAINLTAQNAIDDLLRGEFHHAEIDGSQHLYEVHGGKLYEVNKSTGGLTEKYDMTGQGEAWADSAFGSFYCINGAGGCKIEGTTAYRIGIAAPTGVTATPQTTGGSLPDGVYKLYASYARQVSGADVLYSTGGKDANGVSLIANVTISGGGGSGSIDIASFANSADAQVGNKVIWMTYAGLSTYYLWDETGDNTTTSFTITSATPNSLTLTYGNKAAFNDLIPANLEFLFFFDRRLFGYKNNILYFSEKGFNKYDLEVWPLNNFIRYHHKITGLFDCGGHLCINTKSDGVMFQPFADINAKVEHYERQTSFEYMRTVGKWSSNRIGMTEDRIGVFRADTMAFEPFDYGYNIRPVLDRVWADDDSDHRPCGIVYRRNNRIEYLISVMDTNVNSTNNNRTFALNLSRTLFYDVDNNKTPWEILGRGCNYIVKDSSNTLFMGQSFTASSTIYKELSTATTEIGLYKDAGTYLTTATNMLMYVLSKTIRENMFTDSTIENMRVLFQAKSGMTILVTIVDNPGNTISQETDAASTGQTNWDFTWDVDSWSAESLQQYEFKGDQGVHGYSWNIKLSQTANDINFDMSELNVLVKLQTGNGI